MNIFVSGVHRILVERWHKLVWRQVCFCKECYDAQQEVLKFESVKALCFRYGTIKWNAFITRACWFE